MRLPYLSEPYLEFSNNLPERCAKPFVAGARRTVRPFSIIRTAIINGLGPYSKDLEIR